jgi:bis(5'-nucleosyl)-tetraphosphatase (symmetrical)
MRWIVGDVHGCVRELDDLLKLIRFDPGTDVLWSCGDLVNTGPESARTLKLWREAGGRSVIGNHDAYALLARAGRVPRRKDKLEELFADPDVDSLLDILRAAPAIEIFRRDGGLRDVALLHAGVNPAWRSVEEVATLLESKERNLDWLQTPELAFLTRVRCCDAAGNQVKFGGKPDDAPPPFRPWDDFYKGDHFVVHGHWAMRGFYRSERTMGLDSACVYGGRLIAWALEEDRVESVPCRVAVGYKA